MSQGLSNIDFTSVLHMHNRKREHHPHLHIMVPNGGFDPKRKQWRKGKKGTYLMNFHSLTCGEHACSKR
jgi:hypothetical protein